MTNPPGHSPTGDSARPGRKAAMGSMRIGDTERTSALDALAEHLTTGRLTLDEFGERTAKATVARTVDELSELFDDLPVPHPTAPPPHGSVGQHPAAVVPPTAGREVAPIAARSGSALEQADRRSRAQKLVAAAASVSVFAALALFFLTGTWLWFLLIPAISGIAKAVWGTDWNEPHRGGPGPRELGGDSGRH